MFLFHFVWFVISGLIRVFTIIVCGALILTFTDNAMEEIKYQVTTAQIDRIEQATAKLEDTFRNKLVNWRNDVRKNGQRASLDSTYRF